MKFYCFIILSFSLVVFHEESRHELLCQKWWLFGIKEQNKPFTSISRSSTLLFKKDGKFEQHNLIYDSKGIWEFNIDTTKIISRTLNAKGAHLGTVPIYPVTDSIIRLTKDTLVYISENNTMWYYVSDK